MLSKITAWAAFLLGLVPLVARPVLAWSVRGFAEYSAGILAGSLLGVVLLFAVPVTLLGCVSPFAIRLAVTDVQSAGKTAGGRTPVISGRCFGRCSSRGPAGSTFSASSCDIAAPAREPEARESHDP